MYPSTARRASAFWFGVRLVSWRSLARPGSGDRAPVDESWDASPIQPAPCWPDVRVRLTNQATSVARETKTNASGDYSFLEVVPGVYTVEFELAGFKKNVQKNVTVEVNQVVTLNSVLQIGAGPRSGGSDFRSATGGHHQHPAGRGGQ